MLLHGSQRSRSVICGRHTVEHTMNKSQRAYVGRWLVAHRAALIVAIDRQLTVAQMDSRWPSITPAIQPPSFARYPHRAATLHHSQRRVQRTPSKPRAVIRIQPIQRLVHCRWRRGINRTTSYRAILSIGRIFPVVDASVVTYEAPIDRPLLYPLTI